MRPTALVGLARRVIASSIVRRPLLGEREVAHDLVDDLVATRVVLEHDTHDGHEHDRQRHEREEDAIRDAGRVLREAVAEVAVDRHGHGPHEVLDDPQGPPRHAHPEGPLLGGGCLGHPGGV